MTDSRLTPSPANLDLLRASYESQGGTNYNADFLFEDFSRDDDEDREHVGVRYITEDLLKKMSRDQSLECISKLTLTLNKEGGKKIRYIENLDKLRNLTLLNLSCNQIEKIEKLDKLVLLRELNLSFNVISKIEHLDHLVNLQTLNLTGNRITMIPISLAKKLKGLRVLKLAKNKIQSLHHVANLWSLSNLTQFTLSENPVSRLSHYRPYVIFQLKTIELLDCEQVTEEERQESNERFHQEELDRLRKDLEESNRELKESLALQMKRDLENKVRIEREKEHHKKQRKDIERLQHLEDELEKTKEMLHQKTEELTRACHTHYQLEQDLAFHKIDTKFESLGQPPDFFGEELASDEEFETDEYAYIGKCRYTHKELARIKKILVTSRVNTSDKSIMSEPLDWEEKEKQKRKQIVASLDKELEDKRMLLNKSEKRLSELQRELRSTEQRVLQATLDLNRLANTTPPESVKEDKDKLELREKLVEKIASVNQLKDSAEHYKEQIDQIDDELIQKRYNLDNLQDKLLSTPETDPQLRNLQREMRNKEEQLTANTQHYKELQDQLDNIIIQIKDEAEDIRDMERHLFDNTAENDFIRDELENIIAGLSEYVNVVKELSSEHNPDNRFLQQEKAANQKRLQDIKKAHKLVQQELQSTRAEAEAAKQRAADIEKKITDSDEEMKQLRSTLAGVRRQAEEEREELLAELEKERSQVDKLLDQSLEADEMRKQLEDLKSAYQNLQSKMDSGTQFDALFVDEEEDEEILLDENGDPILTDEEEEDDDDDEDLEDELEQIRQDLRKAKPKVKKRKVRKVVKKVKKKRQDGQDGAGEGAKGKSATKKKRLTPVVAKAAATEVKHQMQALLERIKTGQPIPTSTKASDPMSQVLNELVTATEETVIQREKEKSTTKKARAEEELMTLRSKVEKIVRAKQSNRPISDRLLDDLAAELEKPSVTEKKVAEKGRLIPIERVNEKVTDMLVAAGINPDEVHHMEEVNVNGDTLLLPADEGQQAKQLKFLLEESQADYEEDIFELKDKIGQLREVLKVVKDRGGDVLGDDVMELISREEDEALMEEEEEETEEQIEYVKRPSVSKVPPKSSSFHPPTGPRSSSSSPPRRKVNKKIVKRQIFIDDEDENRSRWPGGNAGSFTDDDQAAVKSGRRRISSTEEEVEEELIEYIPVSRSQQKMRSRNVPASPSDRGSDIEPIRKRNVASSKRPPSSTDNPKFRMKEAPLQRYRRSSSDSRIRNSPSTGGPLLASHHLSYEDQRKRATPTTEEEQDAKRPSSILKDPKRSHGRIDASDGRPSSSNRRSRSVDPETANYVSDQGDGRKMSHKSSATMWEDQLSSDEHDMFELLHKELVNLRNHLDSSDNSNANKLKVAYSKIGELEKELRRHEYLFSQGRPAVQPHRAQELNGFRRQWEEQLEGTVGELEMCQENIAGLQERLNSQRHSVEFVTPYPPHQSQSNLGPNQLSEILEAQKLEIIRLNNILDRLSGFTSAAMYPPESGQQPPVADFFRQSIPGQSGQDWSNNVYLTATPTPGVSTFYPPATGQPQSYLVQGDIPLVRQSVDSAIYPPGQQHYSEHLSHSMSTPALNMIHAPPTYPQHQMQTTITQNRLLQPGHNLRVSDSLYCNVPEHHNLEDHLQSLQSKNKQLKGKLKDLRMYEHEQEMEEISRLNFDIEARRHDLEDLEVQIEKRRNKVKKLLENEERLEREREFIVADTEAMKNEARLGFKISSSTGNLDRSGVSMRTRYQELRNEVNCLEKTIRSRTSELTQVERELTQSNMELQQIKSQAQTTVQRYDNARLAHDSLLKETDELQEKAREAGLELVKVTNEYKSLKKEVSDLERQKHDYELTLMDIQQVIASRDNEYQMIENGVKFTSERLHRVERDLTMSSEKEREKIKIIKEGETLITDKRMELDKLKQYISTEQANLEKIDHQLGSKRTELALLEEQTSKRQEDLSSQSRELGRELASRQRDLRELQIIVDNLNEEKKTLLRTVSELQHEKDSLVGNNDVSKANLQMLISSINQAKSELKRLEDHIRSAVGESSKFSDQIQAKSKHLDQIHAQIQEELINQEQIETNRKRKVAEIDRIRDTHSKEQGAIDELSSERRAIESSLTLLNKEKEILQESNKSLENRQANLKKQMQQLEETVFSGESRLDKLQIEKDSLISTIEVQKTERDGLRNQLSQMENQVRHANAELKSIRERIDQYANTTERSELEMRTKLRQRDDLSSDVRSLQEKLRALQLVCEQAEDRKSTCIEEFSKVEHDLVLKKEELREVTKALTKTKRDLEMEENRMTRILNESNAELTNLKADLSQKQEEMETATHKFNQVKREMEQKYRTEERLIELEKIIKEQDGEMNASRCDKQDLSSSLAKSYSELAALREEFTRERDSNAASVHSLEVELEAARAAAFDAQRELKKTKRRFAKQLEEVEKAAESQCVRGNRLAEDLNQARHDYLLLRKQILSQEEILEREHKFEETIQTMRHDLQGDIHRTSRHLETSPNHRVLNGSQSRGAGQDHRRYLEEQLDALKRNLATIHQRDNDSLLHWKSSADSAHYNGASSTLLDDTPISNVYADLQQEADTFKRELHERMSAHRTYMDAEYRESEQSFRNLKERVQSLEENIQPSGGNYNGVSKDGTSHVPHK